MKLVKQRILHTEATPGDCMTAAVASLFEIPYEQVPYYANRDDWFAVFEALVVTQGYTYHGTALSLADVSIGIGGWFLCSGQSPRHPDKHHMCLIHLDGTLLDPHPSNAGLDTLEHIWEIS